MVLQLENFFFLQWEKIVATTMQIRFARLNRYKNVSVFGNMRQFTKGNIGQVNLIGNEKQDLNTGVLNYNIENRRCHRRSTIYREI